MCAVGAPRHSQLSKEFDTFLGRRDASEEPHDSQPEACFGGSSDTEAEEKSEARGVVKHGQPTRTGRRDRRTGSHDHRIGRHDRRDNHDRKIIGEGFSGRRETTLLERQA